MNPVVLNSSWRQCELIVSLICTDKYRNVINMCIYLDQYIVTCFLGLSAEEIRVVTPQ